MKTKHLSISFCLILALMFVAGCAPTRVKVIKEYTPEKSKAYKKVFLVTTKDDPRNVYPIVERNLRQIGFDVEVVKSDDPIGASQGSGFVIHPDGYILTCAHVIGEEKKATVWLQGKRLEADVLHKDKDKDLALLKITGSDIPLAPLAMDLDCGYKMGQDVFSLGFPLSKILGNSPRLNKGLLSSTVGMKDSPDYVQVSAEVQPGNSGGPLFNSRGGVIGMMQATLNPLRVLNQTGGNLPQNVNFALKNKMIKAFIDHYPEKIALNLNVPETADFEKAQKSVVQVYSGIVTESDLKQPKIVCAVVYQSFWDMWYRFRVFNVDFYDLETGELLLRAGQYGDNPLSTETKVIEMTFVEIKNKFFPGG